MDTAKRIIDDLKKQGLTVSDEKRSRNLLTYKTNYSLLRRNQVSFWDKISENKDNGAPQYRGINFTDYSISSRINHEITVLYSQLFHDFEHELKVYIEEIFQTLSFTQKEEIKDGFRKNAINKRLNGECDLNKKIKPYMWKNSKIVAKECTYGEWMKIVDYPEHRTPKIKWYYILDQMYLSEITKLYLTFFHKYATEIKIYCNTDRSGAMLRKTPDAFLTRLVYRRNDSSHQNLLFTRKKANGNQFYYINQFLDFIDSKYYDKFTTKKSLLNLLSSNLYNFDLFYLLITKDLLLSRHPSLQKNRTRFHDKVLYTLEVILKKSETYSYCDNWVSESLQFFKLTYKIIDSQRIQKTEY